MLFPVRTQRALTNRNNLKSTLNPFPYVKRGQLLQTAWGTRRSLEEALNPSDQFSSINLLSHQERPWEDLATLGQWSHRYPKPQKFPKSLPTKGHIGLSQPWVPSTKSQTASLVSLNRLQYSSRDVYIYIYISIYVYCFYKIILSSLQLPNH